MERKRRTLAHVPIGNVAFAVANGTDVARRNFKLSLKNWGKGVRGRAWRVR